MKSRLILLVLVLVVSVLISNSFSLNGQVRFTNPSLKAAFGMYTSWQYDLGYTGGLEVNTALKRKLFSIDYLHYREMDLFWSSQPRENYNQIAAYLGTYFGERLLRLDLQTGLSAFWGVQRGDKYVGGGSTWGGATYNKERFFELGIPMKIGFKIIPFHFLAFGIDIKGNFNLEKQLIYPLLTLEMGRLRKKK
ncbi:MAG: hypothetical protein KJ941_05500 [Bacteroidetes bacterium]|nr:hypothetical protein [Bacteroidota bacterium]